MTVRHGFFASLALMTGKTAGASVNRGAIESSVFMCKSFLDLTRLIAKVSHGKLKVFTSGSLEIATVPTVLERWNGNEYGVARRNDVSVVGALCNGIARRISQRKMEVLASQAGLRSGTDAAHIDVLAAIHRIQLVGKTALSSASTQLFDTSSLEAGLAMELGSKSIYVIRPEESEPLNRSIRKRRMRYGKSDGLLHLGTYRHTLALLESNTPQSPMGMRSVASA